MRRLRYTVALVVLAVLAACGEDQQVGSEALLQDLGDGPQGQLGVTVDTPAPDATPAPLAVGATPEPTAVPTPPPTPVPQYFDVSLVADSPFYEPGHELHLPVGTILRVTNRDATPGRDARSFTAEDGSFDSGLLAPGQSWTRTFDAPGSYRIVDGGLTFARATLVIGGS